MQICEKENIPNLKKRSIKIIRMISDTNLSKNDNLINFELPPKLPCTNSNYGNFQNKHEVQRIDIGTLAKNKIKELISKDLVNSSSNQIAVLEASYSETGAKILILEENIRQMERDYCSIINRIRENAIKTDKGTVQNSDSRTKTFFAHLRAQQNNKKEIIKTINTNGISSLSKLVEIKPPFKSNSQSMITESEEIIDDGIAIINPPETETITSVNSYELVKDYIGKLNPQQIPIAPLPNVNTITSPHLTNGLPAIQPELTLELCINSIGIELKWYSTNKQSPIHDSPTSYQIYQYNTGNIRFADLTENVWSLMGEVDAMPLPMICTLNSCEPNTIYYFAVRSRDKFGRNGPWSNVTSCII